MNVHTEKEVNEEGEGTWGLWERRSWTGMNR